MHDLEAGEIRDGSLEPRYSLPETTSASRSLAAIAARAFACRRCSSGLSAVSIEASNALIRRVIASFRGVGTPCSRRSGRCRRSGSRSRSSGAPRRPGAWTPCGRMRPRASPRGRSAPRGPRRPTTACAAATAFPSSTSPLHQGAAGAGTSQTRPWVEARSRRRSDSVAALKTHLAPLRTGARQRPLHVGMPPRVFTHPQAARSLPPARDCGSNGPKA